MADSVSDVDPDDLAEMMKGIDDLDDDLFGQKKKDPVKDLSTKPVVKTGSESTQESERKVKFSEKAEYDWDEPIEKGEEKVKEQPVIDKEAVKDKPRKRVEIKFDDDDILGGLESRNTSSKSKPSASFMDDIFGKSADKEKKSTFLDDILSGTTKEKAKESKSEFKLPPNYKQPAPTSGGSDAGELSQPRRRRGNPTVGPTLPPGPPAGQLEQVQSAVAKPPDNVNPFPWMAVKSEDVKESNQKDNTKLIESIHQVEQTLNQNQSNKPAVMPISSTIQFTPTLPHPHPVTVVSNILQGTQVVDQQNQQVFNQDMENYKRLMSDRKIEHAAAIENQRQELAIRMQELQERQIQVE